MSNHIFAGNTYMELTDEQAAAIVAAIRELKVVGTEMKQLSEFAPGEVVKIGDYELVVLEQIGEMTYLICKGLVAEEVMFGASNNNYVGSLVESVCQTFAEKITEAVGDENIIRHDVDLTTLDGLKDYGTIIDCRASLLTLPMYQRYVDVLDQHKRDKWWWLATATSTKRHENDRWALCVSPSGNVSYVIYLNARGVRPFCILNSSIFVSCRNE